MKILIAFCLFILITTGHSQIIYTPNVVAFIGDYGSNDEDEDSVSALVKSWNPEAVITLGDNNYPNGSAADIDINVGKYYHDYIKPYSGSYGASADTNRFWPCLGNHDLMTSSGSPYFNYFQLPNNERYYDFVIGDIHFFCLNSDPSEIDGVSETSTQGLWLQNKLQNSVSKWKIVYGHYSPYCSDAWYGNHSYMQWPFKNWGADIVLSGHAHLYERLVVDSFPYIVNGLGGQSKYNFSSTPEPGSVVRYNDKYGALQLTAKPDTLCFRFCSVNNDLIDSFILYKSQVGIEENVSNILTPKVYPNPSSGNICLDWGSYQIQGKQSQISIKTILGKEIYFENFAEDQSVHSKIIILPKGISNGVYFLQITSEARKYVTKIVLNH